MGLRLALIGSIKDEILNVDELAVELVKFLKAEYPGLLAQRYEVSEENDIIELISAVAVNRKCLSKGGEPDYSKAAALIIDDFRSGKLDWNSSTVVKYGSTWYFVSGGKVNWNAYGLCEYGGQY